MADNSKKATSLCVWLRGGGGECMIWSVLGGLKGDVVYEWPPKKEEG